MPRATFAMLVALIVGLSAVVSDVRADECMDCGEKRTQRHTASGNPIWPQQSDALCCDFPCYSGYEVRDENVGWGCLTCSVNNEIVVGTICCSSNDDQDCPSSGGGGPGGPRNDDAGCVRDSSGACPADCASCI